MILNDQRYGLDSGWRNDEGLNKKNILFIEELYKFLFLMYLNDMPAMFSP